MMWEILRYLGHFLIIGTAVIGTVWFFLYLHIDTILAIEKMEKRLAEVLEEIAKAREKKDPWI